MRIGFASFACIRIHFASHKRNMNYRDLRVGNLIRDELAKLMIKEFEFPGAVVTITEVEVDKKLETAAVKMSVLPSEKAEKVLKALRKGEQYFQHLVSDEIHIKPMPKIRFELDHGPENAARVERLLMEEK